MQKMGIFGTSTDTVTEEVERATNENNKEENWDQIIAICDKAGKSADDAKAYLRAITKRLYSNDPHIGVQAVTLLDACVKNSGKLFHTEVASREFENDFVKLMSKAHAAVSLKLRQALKRWAEGEFKTDQQLNLIPSLYSKLKSSGVDFAATDMPAKKSAPISTNPNVVESQEEENQILKAIELSLKESTSSPRAASASASLYPSTNLSLANASASATTTPVKEPKKVRALYDFEAAEDNELTFRSGEIIFVIDDSDPNWWKGSNQRGEGLFPSNFVTKDLDVEPEKFLYEKAKKIVQFKETVDVKPTDKEPEEDVEINEDKIDRLLHLLHEADPTNPETDTVEMLKLEREVNGMGPLIDAELERVDRKHAQLTQLSADLVEALSLYHTLMREPQFPPKMPYNYNQMAPQQQMPPNSMVQHQPTYNGLPPPPTPHGMMPPPPGMHYATMPMMPPGMGGAPPQGMPPGMNPYMMHQMPDDRRTHSYANMVHPGYPPVVPTGSQTLIHNGPPQPQGQHYMPASNSNPK